MSAERVLVVLALVAAAIVGSIQFGYLKMPARERETAFSSNVADAVARLKANTRPDIFRELDTNAQELLVNLVREHCSRGFDEQSCLHYVISCGRPCLAFLTKPERLRALASYRKLSSAHGGDL